MKICDHCGKQYHGRPLSMVPLGVPPRAYDKHCSLDCWTAASKAVS